MTAKHNLVSVVALCEDGVPRTVRKNINTNTASFRYQGVSYSGTVDQNGRFFINPHCANGNPFKSTASAKYKDVKEYQRNYHKTNFVQMTVMFNGEYRSARINKNTGTGKIKFQVNGQKRYVYGRINFATGEFFEKSKTYHPTLPTNAIPDVNGRISLKAVTPDGKLRTVKVNPRTYRGVYQRYVNGKNKTFSGSYNPMTGTFN